MISAWYRWISFNTQPPEGGWTGTGVGGFGCLGVSTHSRLKAAGDFGYRAADDGACFNTQPPEGGWSQFSADVV